MNLGKPALLAFEGNPLSDHNRSSLDVSPERIENRVRTARGRMRKSYVANKMQFSWGWTDLPGPDSATVDKQWGAESVIDFYNSTPGSFTLTVVDDAGVEQSYEVVFNEFSWAIKYRYDHYYYDMNISLEEV